MELPPTIRRDRVVCGRGQDRVGEPDPISLECENARPLGTSERAPEVRGGRSQTSQEVDRRRPRHRRELDRFTDRGGQLADPRSREIDGTAGRQGVEVFFEPLASERTGELERRERIAARKFRDPKQSRPRGSPSEGRAQDAREPARFDGPEADRVDPAFRHRLIQLERPASSGLAPLNHGDAGARPCQPADGIGERSNRRSIQPLHVVDGHEEGAGRRHGADTGVDRDGERQPVEGSLGLFPAKDQVQHPCLGRREGRDDVATDAIEELQQPDVGQIHLRAGRSARQAPETALAGHLEQSVEERRLADARLALDQQRAGLFGLIVEHALDDVDLIGPAYDRARQPITTRRDGPSPRSLSLSGSIAPEPPEPNRLGGEGRGRSARVPLSCGFSSPRWRCRRESHLLEAPSATT